MHKLHQTMSRSKPKWPCVTRLIMSSERFGFLGFVHVGPQFDKLFVHSGIVVYVAAQNAVIPAFLCMWDLELPTVHCWTSFDSARFL